MVRNSLYSSVKETEAYSQSYHHILEQIISAYHTRVFRYIQRLVGDPELSADIRQDTFLALYVILQSRGSLEDKANPAGFLAAIQPLIYTIARNKAVDELRRRKYFRLVPFIYISQSAAGASAGQEELDQSIEFQAANRAGNSLEAQVVISDELKRAIEQIGRRRLHSLFLHLNGFSYKEIGQITGDSMSTVKSKIFRSKQSLRQVLANQN